jgi:hypothetical protein
LEKSSQDPIFLNKLKLESIICSNIKEVKIHGIQKFPKISCELPFTIEINESIEILLLFYIFLEVVEYLDAFRNLWNDSKWIASNEIDTQFN